MTSRSLESNIDIGIIANSTSATNRLELIEELGKPQEGLFAPLKFSFQGLKGHIIPLDIQPQDIFSVEKLPAARQACLLAADKLVESGAKVVCFTASTKRLPGKNGANLQKKPYANKVVFSIGDSATTLSFLATIKEGLKNIDEHEKVVVVGGGFLGLEAIKFIEAEREGRQDLTLLSKHSQCLPSGIKVARSTRNLKDPVRLLIVCAHKHNLNVNILQRILDKDSIVIDVAAPPGIPAETFNQLQPRPVRWSAGDFYLQDISYSFPAQILSFPSKHFFYGCFTEALCLGLASQESANGSLKKFNFFKVNEDNQDLLKPYLRQIKAEVPLIDLLSKDIKIRTIDF